ncbi:hypothetical protein LSAT2_001659 [Lamellibrachia satsuma]|nr:hypothetical protein LSAT2_001659 [Lamellibrachia satsuma]
MNSIFTTLCNVTSPASERPRCPSSRRQSRSSPRNHRNNPFSNFHWFAPLRLCRRLSQKEDGPTLPQ